MSQYIPVLLMASAMAMGAFAMVNLFLRTRAKSKEDWRDPPPLIFKLFKPVVRLFSSDMRGAMSDSLHKRINTRLSTGGMSYAILAEEFFTLKFVCLVFMCLISYLLFSMPTEQSAEARLFLVVLIPLGFFYPDIWLNDKVTRRRARVAKEFPFLLDLLVLSMRAGLNYSTSLGQAITNLPEGPVKEEFGKLLREIRAGKVRRQALLDLAARMDTKSIHNFVAAINQAEETGGEIVEVLTLQAEQRRTERFNQAEESANKAPVKMLLPLVLFLFPIIFMLIAFLLIVKLADSNILPPMLMNLLV